MPLTARLRAFLYEILVVPGQRLARAAVTIGIQMIAPTRMVAEDRRWSSRTSSCTIPERQLAYVE